MQIQIHLPFQCNTKLVSMYPQRNDGNFCNAILPSVHDAVNKLLGFVKFK